MAIERAVREGRAGKGVIYTFTSGNENTDVVNMQIWRLYAFSFRTK
jgi:hypothetical protein